MFHPIPSPTLPLKGRERCSSPLKGRERCSSPFKGEAGRGMGARTFATINKNHIFRMVLAGILTVSSVHARQDSVPVTRAIENYLKRETQGLPGQVRFETEASGFAADNHLTPCRLPVEVSQPPGARTWGRIHLTVRCPPNGGNSGWSVFVPAHVRVFSEYLVSVRSIALGQTLSEADFTRQQGDLSELPAGVLTQPPQAIGQVTTAALSAGQPLRRDILRPPFVVRQNQTVKIISRGAGFEVAAEGRALTNAAEGQWVQVRLNNGQTISGLARTQGIVEMTR
ncbi:MAG: flagellar basal body P-ring formation chaperone FlgA [Rhodocyclaceae bacterium]|nr:flagellar basal body P-ring formation chaperone FlgA [Rhodocyclaceae bacterium]